MTTNDNVTGKDLIVPKAELGIIIGRFQPFHNGHKALIDKALKECKKVLVLVGSSNKLPNHKNPLTTEERMKMVEGTYGNSIVLRGLADNPSLTEWVGNVYGHYMAITGDIDPTLVNLYTGDSTAEFYNEYFAVRVVTAQVQGLPESKDILRKLYYGQFSMGSSLLPSQTRQRLIPLMKTTHWDRMCLEHRTCKAREAEAFLGHKYNNPIEPVAHAVVVRGDKILLVKRNSTTGYGQWACPGGFVQGDETTVEAALRELKEETGVDLIGKRAVQMACCVEENLEGLSVRSLGINYLFAVHREENLEITIAPEEVLKYKWGSLKDILNEKEILFYNHNLIVQRLYASISEEGDQKEAAND